MVVLEGEEFLAVDEAARLLGVKPATLYAYVSRGLLRSYRQGIKRQRLYRRSEVEALVRLAPSSAAESSASPAGEAEGQVRVAGGGRRARRRPVEIPLAESWIRD
jgi:citrate synthase